MKIPTSRATVSGATLLAPIAWGTTYVTVTELLPGWGSLWVPVVRVVPAGLAIVGATLLRSRWRPHGAAWRRLVLLAVANFAVFFPLLVVAVYRMPGGVAAAVGGVQPILVLMLTWALGGRRPRHLDLAVGVLAAAGVALVVIRPGAHVDVVGVLAALGANLSFALGVVLTKRWPVEPEHRVAATGWQLLVSSALLLPLAIALDGLPPAPDAAAVAGIAHLSLLGTAAAFVLWFRGVRSLPTAAPPLLGIAAPVTGVVLGWAVRGETLSGVQLLGFAIVIGAIAHGAVGGRGDRDGQPRVTVLERTPATSMVIVPRCELVAQA